VDEDQDEGVGMRQAYLIVVFLVLAAGGCVLFPVKALPPEGALDHYLCYDFPEDELKPKPEVILADQFSPAQSELPPTPVNVEKRKYLCNPVEKKFNGKTFPRHHEDAHLVCYTITSEQVDKKVVIDNQFQANKKLTIDRSYLLCLPTGKWKTADVPNHKPKQTPDIPKDLSHFKCYRPYPEDAIAIPVHLRDQFLDRDFTAVELTLLCNPAGKELANPSIAARVDGLDAGLKMPKVPKAPPPDSPHLVCYTLAPTKSVNESVKIHNQFERGPTLVATNPVALCVPSTKTEVSD
jgi:hypothetical protein